MYKLALGAMIRQKWKRSTTVKAFVSQCLLPVHKTPSPVYPTMHSHRYEPSVFVQVAKWEQSSVFELHSSVSDKGKTALIEINMTNRAITTAVTICKSSGSS